MGAPYLSSLFIIKMAPMMPIADRITICRIWGTSTSLEQMNERSKSVTESDVSNIPIPKRIFPPPAWCGGYLDLPHFIQR
jgi:hypothetical protein